MDGVNPNLGQFRLTAIAATLRMVQIFAGLPPADLEEIAGFAVLKSLERDAYLFREGEPPEGFYVVQRGAINVHRVSPSGKEQVIAIFRAGASFAEVALVSAGGYPADARAVEDSTVILIPKAPFVALLSRRTDLGLRMLAAMSAHLRVLVNLVEDMTLKDVETRLINWILKRCPAGSSESVDIELDSTKRVLAAELSTSSETLSRTFARLRDEELLAVRGSTLSVPAPDALRERFRHLLGES